MRFQGGEMGQVDSLRQRWENSLSHRKKATALSAGDWVIPRLCSWSTVLAGGGLLKAACNSRLWCPAACGACSPGYLAPGSALHMKRHSGFGHLGGVHLCRQAQWPRCSLSVPVSLSFHSSPTFTSLPRHSASFLIAFPILALTGA